MLSINYYNRLDLPYGDMHGADQDWACIPGEEVCTYPEHSLLHGEQLNGV